LLHQERSTPETPLEEVLMLLSRRVLCVVSSLLIFTAAPPAFATPTDQQSLPPRAVARIAHIVVVMLENRSFDHRRGWLPTVDAGQTTLFDPDA
jgi:phospholipase C